MARRSHVARRVAAQIDRDFPASPTLAGTVRCAGLAFVLREPAPLPALRAVRDDILGIWCGPLGSEPDAPVVTLVRFVTPIDLDAALCPGALRLVASPAGSLTSFTHHADHAATAQVDAAPNPRRIDLWWGGRAHRIAIDTLASLPTSDLWDMPDLVVHRPSPKPVERAPSASSRRGAVGEGDADEDLGLAPVSRAVAPIGKSDEDFLGDMTADLRGRKPGPGIAAILGLALAGLFAGRVVGGDGGARAGGLPQGQGGGPGLLQNFIGWLRWHSPLGEGLSKQFGGRISQVEKLIASGDLDAALRLALKVGAGTQGGQRNRFPNRLPDMRGSLDFDIASEGFSWPILNDASFFALRNRYAKLAEDLERAGDYRRAAYIHSQLLGDHRRAVLTLEAGELFREAAKLAMDSRQEPALTIRMLFLAGDRAAALALAKRTGCFEQLAQDSRNKDPDYHAYVVKAWTDMLLATGQPLRALQVTDHLMEDVADTALLSLRRRWLADALGVESGDDYGAELAVRGLYMAQWTEDDLVPSDLDDFPFMANIRGSGPYPALLAWLQTMVGGDIADEAEGARRRLVLLDLLGALSRLADPEREEQAGFWNGPAQPVVEAFARGVLAHASDGLDQLELQALESLLTRARLPVFATDMRKLRKLHRARATGKSDWHVPPATATRPVARVACLIGNGTMLVWRESNLLQLIDRHGAVLWQSMAGDVTALVAIGASPNVIIVQAQRDGTSMLTRFASHTRHFYPIGRVRLLAHHDLTSESQWMVQIGGDIGALDLVKLCAREPGIAFLWSCALTERLRAIAFNHLPGGSSWLTCDISPAREGALEQWTLSQAGQLTTNICVPFSAGTEVQMMPPADWCWFSQHNTGRMHSTGTPRKWMNISPWSEYYERGVPDFIAIRRTAGFTGIDTFQSCDFGRLYVGATAASGSDGPAHVTPIAMPNANAPTLLLRHGEDVSLTCLARAAAEPPRAGQTSPASGAVLLADNHGRLFLVQARDKRVTVIAP